jgi:hypothetical protein
MRRPSSSSLIAAVTLAGALLVDAPAWAGWRLAEKNGDDPVNLSFIEVGGFVQPGLFSYTGDSTAQAYSNDNLFTGFLLQRARINLKAQYTKYFFASLEVEMAGGAPSLTDAYVESRVFQGLQFRIGQFLVPALQSYQFSEINTAFIDRELYLAQAQTRQFISYLQPRDIGFMVFGTAGDLAPASTQPVLEYGVGVFNGNGANNPSNAHQAFMYTARLQLDILGFPKGRYTENDFARNETPRVAVGVGGIMNCDTEKNWNRGFTADAELRYRGLYASASFVWVKNSGATGDALATALNYNYQCTGGGTPAFLANGGHVQVQYLIPVAAIVTGGGVELLGRFDAVNPFNAPSSFIGSNDPTNGGYAYPTTYDSATDVLPSRWRFTFGVNWYPLNMTQIHVSLNYQFIHETEPFIPNPEVGQVLLNTNVFWAQLTAGI